MATKKKHIFSVNAIRDKMNYTNKPTYKRLGEFMNDGYDTLSVAELNSLKKIVHAEYIKLCADIEDSIQKFNAITV